MAKPAALSNRQRKLARKTVARPGRPAPVQPAEKRPTGLQARVEIQEQLASLEAPRIQAALRDGAVGEHGPVDPRGEVAMEFGTDLVDGRLRIRSRDGLLSLHRSKALTDDLLKAGLAYRYCYELTRPGLGSGLGNAGEGGRGSRKVAAFAMKRSAAELHRAYASARLKQMELAASGGRAKSCELEALRMIAGEGHTARELGGASGQARLVYRDALVRALEIIATHLRIAGH